MKTQALDADIQLAMAGDAAAFTRLVDECANVVCSIALAIVRNVQASEDVAQETFLVVWSSLGKLRNPASFLPWVRQIARNQAHLWLRQNRREVAADEALSAAPDARPTPAEALLRDEERRILQEVIDELPEDSREVVILYYREGSSARHVADLLGISEDAVKQRLSRARAKIRLEMLERFGGTLARTAPAAAFTAVVGAAISAAAPPAAAAVTVAAAAKGGGGAAAGSLAAKAAGIGAAAGVAGVLMAGVHIGSPWDEQEERELRALRNTAIKVVVIASLVFAAVMHWHPTRPAVLAVALPYTAAMVYLYGFRLRRVLARRIAWEQEMIPDAPRGWREWTVGTTGQALAAAVAGANMMFWLWWLMK